MPDKISERSGMGMDRRRDTLKVNESQYWTWIMGGCCSTEILKGGLDITFVFFFALLFFLFTSSPGDLESS